MAHTYEHLPVNVPALFKNIADKTFANAMPEINTALDGSMVGSYIPGTFTHIVERLCEYSNDPTVKDDRFPLIGFIHDFPIVFDVNDANPDVTIRLIIATLTDPNRRSEDRMTSNFVPILDPLYAELMSQIKKSNYFIKEFGLMPAHKVVDHLNWGKEGLYGNTSLEMNEYIDGKEILDLKLKLNTPNCISSGLTAGQVKFIY